MAKRGTATDTATVTVQDRLANLRQEVFDLRATVMEIRTLRVYRDALEAEINAKLLPR